MLPSSPSADYISDALLRLCFGRAVFLLPLSRRTGEHDCASPAVAPQGASRRRLKSLLKHRVQGAALPAMLPSSPSADLSQYAFLRLCFGRAVFVLGGIRRKKVRSHGNQLLKIDPEQKPSPLGGKVAANAVSRRMRGNFPVAAACLRPHQSPAVTASPDRGKPLEEN